MLVYGDDEKIKTEMLAIFDLLNGKTSTSLYKNYIKFFKYVEYYHENEENILEIIMTERRGDKSTFTNCFVIIITLNRLKRQIHDTLLNPEPRGFQLIFI